MCTELRGPRSGRPYLTNVTMAERGFGSTGRLERAATRPSAVLSSPTACGTSRSIVMCNFEPCTTLPCGPLTQWRPSLQRCWREWQCFPSENILFHGSSVINMRPWQSHLKDVVLDSLRQLQLNPKRDLLAGRQEALL